MRRYLAIDLGAESGRVILGTIDDDNLVLEELHRFPNTPVRLPDGFYWDVLRLWHEVKQGLSVAGRGRKLTIDGVGVCTWGVDFALLTRDGSLAANPRHYRDARNNGMVERTTAIVSRERIYEETGVQFMQINSLCQLHAAKLANDPGLAIANKLLFMPDLFAYWLSGVAKAEQTIASTSQFYNPRTGTWATEIIHAFGLPAHILPEIVPAGTLLGTLRPELAIETGLSAETRIYATAGHDTAAAVAAVPATRDKPWCYISSGTWSLMGVELDAPVVNEQALAHNFTNEVGAGGKIRFLKNIMGLWPLQECRRQWQAEGLNLSYTELAAQAAAEPEFPAIIDIDQFLEPGDMPRRIAAAANPAPKTPAQYTRLILQSLAKRYNDVLQSLESLTNQRIEVIHIVGGGSQNILLNKLVAETTKREVIAGPAEATAEGNIRTIHRS